MVNPLADDLDHILSKTEALWEEVRGKRIFITGGTGFFGCWLLESFCWANRVLCLGAEIWVLTRNPESFEDKCPHLASDHAVKLYAGNVIDFEFPQESFPFVIHAATEASAALNVQNPLSMFDTIVHGTRRTLDFARQTGARKFLLTSSGAVYGRQPPEIEHIPEDYAGAPDTMNPRWVYGEGKRCAELLCATYAKRSGIETKIARCWAFVGPYLPLDIHFAVGNFIRDGLKGGPIVVNGDGTPYRSYLYAADLAIWLWTILLKGATCRPYNVGSDVPFSIKELAYLIAEKFEAKSNVLIMKKDEGKAKERYIPSIERAKKELNLQVAISCDEAIVRTIKWHKKAEHE
jgi:dTDP-glucose 4,6-dehydratase